MLHPDRETIASNANDNERGCVLRVDAGDGSALIAADIGRSTEEKLVARFAGLLHADALVVPHHGSRFSSSQAFVAEVRPRLAVASAGYRNRFGHPRPEVERRYREEGALFLRTDRDGAVSVRWSSAGVMEVQRWRQAQPRYWNAPAAAR